MTGSQGATVWERVEISLGRKKRGCHLITDDIVEHREVKDHLNGIKVGICHVFVKHTSASLTINENADPDVRHDMETFLNLVVPETQPGRPNAPWVHTMEGPDDMPAHVKASLLGSSVTIPIHNSQLDLGTWQGIWLCEHRDSAYSRKIVVTINGMK